MRGSLVAKNAPRDDRLKGNAPRGDRLRGSAPRDDNLICHPEERFLRRGIPWDLTCPNKFLRINLSIQD